jgi:hypothetical protein
MIYNSKQYTEHDSRPLRTFGGVKLFDGKTYFLPKDQKFLEPFAIHGEELKILGI